jgi:uncharacterized protein YjbJ (UPF0337 family)
MSGKAEEVKGRIKEAAGTLTGDDKMKNSGKVDQASGKAKQVVDKVIDKAKNAVKGKP